MAESGTIADIQVSVRQITQQSLVSRWYEMRAAIHRVCYPVTERWPVKWLEAEVESNELHLLALL